MAQNINGHTVWMYLSGQSDEMPLAWGCIRNARDRKVFVMRLSMLLGAFVSELLFKK